MKKQMASALVATLALNAIVAFRSTDAQAATKKCVFIDSYHEGYGWSDGIANGIAATLKGKCDLEIFRMDTKRNNNREFVAKKGLEAKAFIESRNPDLVIIADDNAADQVLMAHFKNSKTPFVFCGLNWTVEKYGLPYKNTTGMIEVAPIYPMIQELKKALPNFKTVYGVFPNDETGKKEQAQVSQIFEKQGLKFTAKFVKTPDEFKAAWTEAQKSDFVYFDNTAGIDGWDIAAMTDWVQKNSAKPSASTYEWVGPYVSFLMMKSPEEQGEWAATAGLKILSGEDPAKISMVSNRKFNPLVNEKLMKKAGIKLSEGLVSRAKKL